MPDSLGITRLSYNSYEVYGYTVNPVNYAWFGSFSDFSTSLTF
jgi:hypothetical protein